MPESEQGAWKFLIETGLIDFERDWIWGFDSKDENEINPYDVALSLAQLLSDTRAEVERETAEGCNCEEVEMGSYDYQVAMKQHSNGKSVDIDICLATEIASLWKLGIRTVESCCGHKKTDGYIAVERIEDVNMMLALGYKDLTNKDPDYPIFRHCFFPKFRPAKDIYLTKK